jgi:hypothetical protein
MGILHGILIPSHNGITIQLHFILLLWYSNFLKADTLGAIPLEEENIMPTDHDIDMLRDRIVHLEDQVAFLYKHLGIALSSGAVPGDDPRILGALKKGNTLEAIKVYRELYSSATVTVSLDEAKRAVEEIKRRQGI